MVCYFLFSYSSISDERKGKYFIADKAQSLDCDDDEEQGIDSVGEEEHNGSFEKEIRRKSRPKSKGEAEILNTNKWTTLKMTKFISFLRFILLR